MGEAGKVEPTQVVLTDNLHCKSSQCSITCLAIRICRVGLKTESNKEAKKKEGKDPQKEDTLQPITKVNTKLDRELQEWEVESTKGGANDGGG